MKHRIAIAVLLAALFIVAPARTRTTRTGLRTNGIALDVLPAQSVSADTVASAIDPSSITIRGFNKRASDAKESFLITNNMKQRISAVRLLMRYATMTGELLQERTVNIPVSLKPGETSMVQVKSFDLQRTFYYYAGPKPRKDATPFKVAYRLVGYDVPVGQ